MRIGQRVEALVEMTERDFAGAALHIHARRGDVGEIVDVDRTFITVRFERSGTAYSCTRGEIRAVKAEAA